MNWKASATDCTKSSWRIVVMIFLWRKGSGRGARGGDLRSDFPTPNFTIAGARKILREVNDFRRLVGGEALAPESEQLVGRHRASGLSDDVGDHETFVGSRFLGDARAVRHRGVALHPALHLLRRDPIPEALDDVVLAPEEPQ